MAKPFSRANMLFALITAARGDVLKLAALPEYRSRGKGKGLHSGKKWGPRPSYKDMVQKDNGLWYPKDNGNREVARRVRQQHRNNCNAAAGVARDEGFPTAAKAFKRMALGYSTVSAAG